MEIILVIIGTIILSFLIIIDMKLAEEKRRNEYNHIHFIQYHKRKDIQAYKDYEKRAKRRRKEMKEKIERMRNRDII